MKHYTTHAGLFFAALLIAVFPSLTEASVMVYQNSDGTLYNYVSADAQTNGGISNAKSSGISIEPPTLQRSCYLIDPTAYPSSWTGGQYHSPGDNSVIHWNGSTWYRTGAKKNYHIKYLDCSTDATADTSLTASKVSIVKGDSTTLTWSSEWGRTRKATCSATNFDMAAFVPGHTEQVPQYQFCGNGVEIAGAALAIGNNRGNNFCFIGYDWQWVDDATLPRAYGGSSVLSPTQTTTYSYSCTNANGTNSSSVTVTVLDEPDATCSDSQDNDGDGVIDAQDPDCMGGGAGTENPPPNPKLPDLTASAVLQTVADQAGPATLSATVTNIGGSATGVGFNNLFQIDNDEDHASVFATKVGTSPALAFAVSSPLTPVTLVDSILHFVGRFELIPTAHALMTTPCGGGFAGFIGGSGGCASNAGGGSQIIDPGTNPQIPDIGPGTDITQVTYTFPSPGTWYVRVCADNDAAWKGKITESNENNNCSAGGWKAITVSSNAPRASLSADPSAVASGESAALVWSCLNSTSASIDHGIGEVSPASGGSITSGALFSTTDYTLSCVGEGTALGFTKVKVNEPVVDITARPPLVKKGDSTTITWNSAGATSCIITGPNLNSTDKIGSKVVMVESQAKYTITCNGVSTKSVTVGLVPAFNEQ